MQAAAAGGGALGSAGLGGTLSRGGGDSAGLGAVCSSAHRRLRREGERRSAGRAAGAGQG